uniref:Transposase n=1 Tax=Heterorhabditis bacteriophora TaxID=37862 RepID=A0A1I7WI53_HETBA
MEVHKLVEELKMYDFKKNSVLSFHQKTGISPKTIKKYLTQYNIPHNTKGVRHSGIRDSFGRFCLNYTPLDNAPQDLKELKDIHLVKELKEEVKEKKKVVDITRKRSPEEQIAYIQKSIQKAS